MQRTEKRPTARRATAGLAVANFSERNNGDGRLSARPKGAHPIGQCGDAYRDVGNEREHAYREVGGRAMQGAIAEGRGSVAALGKDWLLPASGALPWPIGWALHPSIST